jgi:hypothetical protein
MKYGKIKKVLLVIILMELSYIFYIWGVIELNISRVSDVWFAIITGIVVAIVILLFKDEKSAEEVIDKEAERKNEKIRTSGTLLSEIKANRNQLQPISDIVDKMVSNYIETSEEENALPNQLILNTNIYSALSEKLGLLDSSSRTQLVQYYSELKHVEEEYNKLELIHGETYTSLLCLQLKEASKTKIFKPGWHEIEEFFRRTKKVYDLGEELIKDLNE